MTATSIAVMVATTGGASSGVVPTLTFAELMMVLGFFAVVAVIIIWAVMCLWKL